MDIGLKENDKNLYQNIDSSGHSSERTRMSQSLKKRIDSVQTEEENVINYYSLNESDRHRAIERLSSKNSVDATRELIQIFYRSQWRETKLFIIKNIVKCSNPRTLEFLIELTSIGHDIPMSTLAIKALGQLDHKLARKYLVQLYKSGPEQLKPAAVLALTEARDRNLVLQFVTDLEEAFHHQHIFLSKNLIFAVGELKCKEARAVLNEIILKTEVKDLALSALMALGKITRDLNDVIQHERKFSNDTFESQIYQNVKNQVMLRSNWKAEDYIEKIFQDKNYHPAMPLELNLFSEADVRAGLDLYFAPEKQKPLFDVLSKQNSSNTSAWYNEFYLGFSNINLDLFYESLSYQHSDSYFEIIKSQKNIKNEKWFDIVIACLPSAGQIFSDIFNGDDYRNLSESEKMLVINQYFNWALIYKFDVKKNNQFEKQLEQLLTEETDFTVQNRIIRAFAQLGFDNNKINSVIKKISLKKEVIDSCLYYFEKVPSAFAIEQLEQFVENELVVSKSCLQVLKALGAQNFEKINTKKIESFLLKLTLSHDVEVRKQILILLIRQPFMALQNFVVSSLSSQDPETQLNAVIAIKSYQYEKSPDDVLPLLSSPIDIIRGRALDTLLTNTSLRAKRLAFDYFYEHIDQADVVEQVCRRFDLPDHASDYFYNKMNDLIATNINHQAISKLIELKEKLFIGYQTNQLLRNEKLDSETRALDKELSKKLSSYNQYDEAAKSALRSAELPFLHPEMYTQSVDKSTSILGYCKALDIILTQHFGRKFLFPKLETKLHEFQNLVHVYELNDSNPSSDRVIKNLDLENFFNQQSLPLHKMTLIGQGILSSKIVNDHFKVIDGLRAWAVVLLLFARKTKLVNKPLLLLNEDDETLVHLCKKLMWLQDLRNPVAHRQILSDFKAVEQVRSEVVATLNSLNKLLKI